MGYFESGVQPSQLFLAPDLHKAVDFCLQPLNLTCEQRSATKKGMTQRHTLTVGFEEITAIELRCGNCGGFVSLPIEREYPRSLTCPSCNREMLPVEAVQARGAIEGLFQSLKAWQKAEVKPLRITFTLDWHLEKKPE